MKEAIRTVLESIYDPEFPDTSHFHPSRGSHSALRRIKEEWGTSRWFLEFDRRKCSFLDTIDRHRLISLLKEEIDDPKFFYFTHKVFSGGRLVGGEKSPDSVPHIPYILAALLGNIYLHKLDQEIGRIRQKYEIPIVQRIRSVLLRTGRLDDQSNDGEEAFAMGWVKSIQLRSTFGTFHSLVSSTPPTSTPRRRGDQKNFVFPILNKPSSLLCAAFLIEAAGPKAANNQSHPNPPTWLLTVWGNKTLPQSTNPYCWGGLGAIQLGFGWVEDGRERCNNCNPAAHPTQTAIPTQQYAPSPQCPIYMGVGGCWVGGMPSQTQDPQQYAQHQYLMGMGVGDGHTVLGDVLAVFALGKGMGGAMRDLIQSCKRRGLLIELGGEARLVLRSERGLARKQAPIPHSQGGYGPYQLIRICYARYADDLLLGIVGAVELLIEIQRRITHFLQVGLNLGVVSAGSTTIAARSTVEFLGTVIREVPERVTPIPKWGGGAASLVRCGGQSPIQPHTNNPQQPTITNTIQLGGHTDRLGLVGWGGLREQEKRLRVKHRIHITASHLSSAIHSKLRRGALGLPIQQTKGMSRTGSLLDAVKKASTLGRAGVISPQVSVCWGTVKHIRKGSREIEFLHSPGLSYVSSDIQQAVSRSGMSVPKSYCNGTAAVTAVTATPAAPAGRKAAGKGGGHWAGSFSSPLRHLGPIQIEAPIKKILRRLKDRGLISRRRPWPTHVACLTNVSDGDIVNWFAGIAISLLSYYRCCDNLYQVRTIVDYQLRWSAIFTLAHKHKSSARNIILKYSKDLHIVNQEGGQTLAEFPNSIELGKLRP